MRRSRMMRRACAAFIAASTLDRVFYVAALLSHASFASRRVVNRLGLCQRSTAYHRCNTYTPNLFQLGMVRLRLPCVPSLASPPLKLRCHFAQAFACHSVFLALDADITIAHRNLGS